jgi:hypothetical protein
LLRTRDRVNGLNQGEQQKKYQWGKRAFVWKHYFGVLGMNGIKDSLAIEPQLTRTIHEITRNTPGILW